MMRNAAWMGMVVLAILVPAVNAGYTPSELPGGYIGGWEGKSSYAVNLAGGQVLQGHIEFAVYDSQAAGNQDMFVPGDRRYLYAYQIFNIGNQATAALSYFGITGITPSGITSRDDTGTYAVADGVDATASSINLSKTAASFEFDNGILAVGKKSYFLLLGSNAAPVVGGYEVVAPADDGDVPIPGDNDDVPSPDTAVPEPATIALLLGGVLMGLRKRK
jgi:hypothetical protein